DVAASTAAVSAGRRPRRRQDHHGRAPDQGAADSRRPRALPCRRAWQPGRAMAGRARREVPSRLRDLTRDRIEASRSGNPFDEAGMWSARLDMLSRNEDLQAKLLAAREWDLVVCDEAHCMSASYFGGEVKYTQRYQLGQRLSGRCRHFLLMIATPHNGKEADFQLFMALLDG